MNDDPSSIRDRVIWRIGKLTYVVLFMNDDGTLNLIVDPGLGRPWSSKSQKMAEKVADECGGMAATFEDAWKLLVKYNMGDDPGNLKKLLTDRIQSQAKIVKSKFFKTNTNQIVDQHGNPVPGSNPN